MRILVSALLVSLVPSTALSQVLSCGDVINENLVNVRSSSKSEQLISKMKNDICDETFSSREEVRERLRSGGWELDVFDMFDNSLKDRKQESTGVYSVERTDFCDKSSSELARSFGANYLEINGEFVLEAYKFCAERQNSNGVYFEYEVVGSGLGQQIKGELKRIVQGAPSSLSYNIVGVSVEPPSANVTCTALTKAIPRNVSDRNPIEVNSTPALFSCTRASEEQALISVQTSEGGFSVSMSSSENDEILAGIKAQAEQLEAEAKRIAELEKEVSASNQRSEELGEQLRQAIGERDEAASNYQIYRNRYDRTEVFRVVRGQQRRGDFWETCTALGGRDFTEAWMRQQCQSRGLTYRDWKKMGDKQGGHCGYTFYALVCSGSP